MVYQEQGRLINGFDVVQFEESLRKVRKFDIQGELNRFNYPDLGEVDIVQATSGTTKHAAAFAVLQRAGVLQHHIHRVGSERWWRETMVHNWEDGWKFAIPCLKLIQVSSTPEGYMKSIGVVEDDISPGRVVVVAGDVRTKIYFNQGSGIYLHQIEKSFSDEAVGEFIIEALARRPYTIVREVLEAAMDLKTRRGVVHCVMREVTMNPMSNGQNGKDNDVKAYINEVGISQLRKCGGGYYAEADQIRKNVIWIDKIDSDSPDFSREYAQYIRMSLGVSPWLPDLIRGAQMFAENPSIRANRELTYHVNASIPDDVPRSVVENLQPSEWLIVNPSGEKQLPPEGL